MYTGVLTHDFTKEQIMSAKKTVHVITEVDGQKYVSEFGGTSVIALTHKDEGTECCIEGCTLCDSHAMMHFIETLFKDLRIEDQLFILFKLSSELGKPGGK